MSKNSLIVLIILGTSLSTGVFAQDNCHGQGCNQGIPADGGTGCANNTHINPVLCSIYTSLSAVSRGTSGGFPSGVTGLGFGIMSRLIEAPKNSQMPCTSNLNGNGASGSSAAKINPLRCPQGSHLIPGALALCSSSCVGSSNIPGCLAACSLPSVLCKSDMGSDCTRLASGQVFCPKPARPLPGGGPPTNVI